MGDTINNPVHGETVRFLEIGDETTPTRFELTVEPQASGPPAHVHPLSQERFDVVSGAVWLKSGRSQRAVEAGERIDVPPGISHTWHNHTDGPAVVLVEIDPGFGAAQFFDEWFQLARDGRLNSKGDSGFLDTMELFHPHIGNLMAVPGIPLGLQRVLARSFAAIARRRGSPSRRM